MAINRLVSFTSVEEYAAWLSWLFRNGMYIKSSEYSTVRTLGITFSQEHKKFKPEWYRNRDWVFTTGFDKIYITHWDNTSHRAIVHQDGRIE